MSVLSGVLDVHSQLLGVVPALISPYFNDLVNFVVKAYEESSCPSALGYIAAAMESFDAEESIAGLDEKGRDLIFSQLLAHLCRCTFTYVTQTKRPSDCPHLIRGLFEMASDACSSAPFESLFALAVACLRNARAKSSPPVQI